MGALTMDSRDKMERQNGMQQQLRMHDNCGKYKILAINNKEVGRHYIPKA